MGVALVLRGGTESLNGNEGRGTERRPSASTSLDKDIPGRGLAVGGLLDLPLRRGLEVLDATPTPMATPTPVPIVPEPGPQGSTDTVWVTFYSCPPYCGDPSGPLPLGEGQAACDWAYMGRRFVLNGREYVCNDTGGAVYGAHVDLFFWREADGWAYLAEYGTEGDLEWLE